MSTQQIPAFQPLTLHVHSAPAFTLAPAVSARKFATWMSLPDGDTEAEQIERVIGYIKEQIVGDGEADRFDALWDQPEYPHALCIETWGRFCALYAGPRPTPAAGPSGSGPTTQPTSPSSTPTSSTPEAPASTPSSATSPAS